MLRRSAVARVTPRAYVSHGSSSYVVEGQKVSTDDNSIVLMPPAAMEQVGASRGDPVLVRSHEGKQDLLVVLADDDPIDGHIRITKSTRNSLLICIGDQVTLSLVEPPEARINILRSVNILPMNDTIKGIHGNLFRTYLQPYFCGGYRPVHVGSSFTISGSFRAVEFKVVGVDPGSFGYVYPDTVLHCEGEAIDRTTEPKPDAVGYCDVGGCSEVLSSLRHAIQHPARKWQQMQELLLHGPAGCGKKTIAQALANETGAKHLLISPRDLTPQRLITTMGKVDKVLCNAVGTRPAVPAVIVIDCAVVPVPHIRLFSERMRNTPRGTQVVWIYTAIDLRMFAESLHGCFDHMLQYQVNMPDNHDRLEILYVHTKNMKIDWENRDTCLRKVADLTEGYTGADLARLCSVAASMSSEEKLGSAFQFGCIDVDVLDAIDVNEVHFTLAMAHCQIASVPQANTPTDVNSAVTESLLQEFQRLREAQTELTNQNARLVREKAELEQHVHAVLQHSNEQPSPSFDPPASMHEILQVSPSKQIFGNMREHFFREAESQFMRMLKSLPGCRIRRVEVIMNGFLWQRYKGRRSLGNTDEQWGFHGTDKRALQRITSSGFEIGGTPGVPIRNGATAGCGVYLANLPDISFPYAKGNRMIMARFYLRSAVQDRDAWVIKHKEDVYPQYVIHY